jgi:hypothetical protein
MKKNILFIIISVLVVIVFLSTAALCNMCGISLVSDAEQENDSDGSPDSEKSGDSKTKSSSSSSESQDSKSANEDKSSGDTKNGQVSIKIKDIVIGDLVNNNVSAVKDLLADNSYTCQPVFETAPDGKEKYNWSVSGGSCDNHTMLMQWNTPSNEGTYTVKLDVTRADGSMGATSKDVYINPSAILGEPPQPPFIVEIRLYDTPGNDHGGHYYAGYSYQVVALVDGANELIDSTDFSATAGSKSVSIDGSLSWETPIDPQLVTITVMIYDSFKNMLDSKSIQVEVEPPPGG